MPLFGVGTAFICQAGTWSILYFWGNSGLSLWSLLSMHKHFPLQGCKYGKVFSRWFAFYALISAFQVISHSRANQFQVVFPSCGGVIKLWRLSQHFENWIADVLNSTGRGKWSSSPVMWAELVLCAAWKRFHVPGRRCMEHIKSWRDLQTGFNLGFVNRPIKPVWLLRQARLGLYFSQVI